MPEQPKLFQFDNSYAQLPEKFYHRQRPVPVEQPELVALSSSLASDLRMTEDGVEPAELASVLAGNLLPSGADPLAIAYAGHQFSHFVPQLGDGRAILLGEVWDTDGVRRDIQLKGSGRTPFSRAGDGRASLGPVIREYVVSEAMHALGVPTTRSLAAVTTGEPVYRERPLPGAVLTRVAASHVRIGTFEYFAARRDVEAIQRLAEYVVDRHYPDAGKTADPSLALLETVVDSQAALVAKWMHVGFIHGVMNTDNMTLSGETIDYGPCAFLDHYDPMMVFSSIDTYGRYAFQNQPTVAQWNLARLAETLLLTDGGDAKKRLDAAETLVRSFSDRFSRHWLAGMRRKIGLFSEQDGDAALIDELLDLMRESEADFTVTFRCLCEAADGNEENWQSLFHDREKSESWGTRWRARLEQEVSVPDRAAQMRRVNPAVIPRNHRIEEVIEAAVRHGDYSPMQRLQRVLARPYQEPEGMEEFALPPKPSERVRATFCGT